MIAILIEVSSIQQYVFSSNKLKENIGASYIIEKKLYGKNGYLEKVLREIINKDFDIEHWKSDSILINECEVGYIGGGNTLVFFNSTQKAKECIEKFSKKCLLEFPNLKLSFGLNENFDIDNYKDSFQILHTDLKIRKSSSYSLTNYPKFGITADCPWSNENAEVFESKSENYISITSNAKLEAAKECQIDLSTIYPCLDNKYVLPEEIDELGQQDDSSYISVVHIDGNGMGNVFSEITSLSALRKKSIAVSQKAHNAMNALLENLIELKQKGGLDELNLDEKSLPIRPILVGGDDVTFICEGRLGVFLAELFINNFYDLAERKKGINSLDKLMDGACAGVAIVKSHFPFYKSVKLAEELCAEAKKLARNDPGSYITFYYSATTFSGELKELRKKTHQYRKDSLFFGPYKLFDADHEKSIEKLKNRITFFNEKWPRNKVMQLREKLIEPIQNQQLFEKEIEEIGLKLPDNAKTLWINNTTPYFDAIELMDFYLDKLIKIEIK